MTPEERYKITSEDFLAIIIDFSGNLRILDRYKNYTVHIMNDRYAVVYIPATEITSRSVITLGYEVIPACFALESERSLEASGVLKIRGIPYFNLRGSGVLIGIIDTGINYTHPAFRYEDGTTKIVSIWDQTIFSENQYPQPMLFGTEYSREQINNALGSAFPYEIVPSRDEIGHGTALAGIAAGNIAPSQDFSGVAPDSELIIVKLKQAKKILRNFFIIPENAIAYAEHDIMWGVQYLIAVARQLRRPLSICIGLGSSQGAHDGRGFLSSELTIIGGLPGITVTVSGGNEGNARRHYFGVIDSSVGFDTMELNIGEDEPGFSLEIWGNPPNTYSIDILSPAGEYIPRIIESLQVNREVTFVFEQTVISIDYLMVESQSGNQLILLRFRKPSPGIWRFQVYQRGDLQGSFHAWLPVEGFISNSTYFLHPNPYTTITSPGNGLVQMTVTAYNPENDVLYPNSSRGYTSINEIKPDLAAPGVRITAPDLNASYTSISGTGASAAHTSGIAALILEWAIVRHNYPGIDSVEVKNFLIRGARRSERLRYPNRDWGYGIVDLYNVFDILRSNLEIRY